MLPKISQASVDDMIQFNRHCVNLCPSALYNEIHRIFGFCDLSHKASVDQSVTRAKQRLPRK